MASESNTVLVTVKNLTGELIQLHVDPSLGLQGVQSALVEMDPEQFPHTGLISLCFANNDQSELTSGDNLLLCVMRTRGLIASSRDILLWNGFYTHYVRLEFMIDGTRYFLDCIHERYENGGGRLSNLPAQLSFFFSKGTPELHPTGGDPVQVMNQFNSRWFAWITCWDLTMSIPITEWIYETARAELLAHWNYREVDFTPPLCRHVKCDCGMILPYGGLSRHRRSGVHRKHVRFFAPNHAFEECSCGEVVYFAEMEEHLRIVHDPDWIPTS